MEFTENNMIGSRVVGIHFISFRLGLNRTYSCARRQMEINGVSVSCMVCLIKMVLSIFEPTIPIKDKVLNSTKLIEFSKTK